MHLLGWAAIFEDQNGSGLGMYRGNLGWPLVRALVRGSERRCTAIRYFRGSLRAWRLWPVVSRRFLGLLWWRGRGIVRLTSVRHAISQRNSITERQPGITRITRRVAIPPVPVPVAAADRAGWASTRPRSRLTML